MYLNISTSRSVVSMTVFSIIIINIVVVTAVWIIWSEVPDHGLGDRGLIFVRNFFVIPVGCGRTHPYVQQLLATCLYQQWRPSCMKVVTPSINLLAPELFFFILSHPVYKMSSSYWPRVFISSGDRVVWKWSLHLLTFWRRNYFFLNFSTFCI